MSFKLYFPSVKRSRKTFNITIIGDATTTIYYPKLITFGELTFGNNDPESEMVLFPGNFKIKFYIDKDKYEETLLFLYAKNTAGEQAKIILEDVTGTTIERFTGFIIPSSIDSNKIDSTFSATFFDNYQFLNLPNDVPNTGPRSFVDLAKYLVADEGLTVEMLTDAKFAVEWVTELYTGTLSTLGGVHAALTDVTYYRTRGDILKAMLNNMASRAVIANGVLTIMPRYYSLASTTSIHRSLLMEKPTIRLTDKKDGLRIRAYPTLGAVYDTYIWGTVEVNGDDNITNNAVDIVIPFSLETIGDPDDGYDLWARSKLDTVYAPIIRETVQVNLIDGYTVVHSLVYLFGNLIWANMSQALKIMETSFRGADYSITDFFEIDGYAGIFRAIKLTQNFNNETSKFVLIESVQDVTFISPT